MSVKDFKVRYHAKRSFQLDLSVLSDFEKGKVFSVVGEYQSVPDGTQVDAIMQMYLDTRTSNWTNVFTPINTYQKTYIADNQEKELGVITLKGAATDLQLYRIQDFLLKENRQFLATYFDYRAERDFVIPDYFKCVCILQDIEYSEIGNNNTYDVTITLKKTTNWVKSLEYSTLLGNWQAKPLGQNAYEYTYDFPYGVDGVDLTTLQFSQIGNNGNETAPFILDVFQASTNLEFWFLDSFGNIIGSGKVFGNYDNLRIVTKDVPFGTTDKQTERQGIYTKINGVWTEINNYDYTKLNFFNLPIGSASLIVRGINDISVKQINASITVFEQYRIEGM